MSAGNQMLHAKHPAHSLPSWAAVFMHPDAYGPSSGRPAPLIEVAIETASTVTDIKYGGLFLKYPNVKFIVARCGGGLRVNPCPRHRSLGTESHGLEDLEKRDCAYT